MGLKSRTYNVNTQKSGSESGSYKTVLKGRHESEMTRVVRDAKKFADDRKDALEKIPDAALRRSAAR